MANKISFTLQELAGIEPPVEGRAEYQCKDIPQLRLRVTHTGVMSFNVYARRKGGDAERITIGKFPDIKPTVAITEAKKIISELALGKSYTAQTAAKRANGSLNDLCDFFMARKEIRVTTFDTYKDIYKNHIEDRLGKRKADTITPDDVRNEHNRIGKTAKRTANKFLGMVRSVYRKSIEMGHFKGSDPTSGIKKFPEQSRDRFLLKDELEIFWEALAESPDHFQHFIEMLLLTGARRANVLAMRWDDINLKGKVWVIPADKAKAGQNITIALDQKALDILAKRKQIAGKSPWVFPADSVTGHYMEPKRAWASLLKRSGLENLRIHDLRRTLGSWMASSGINSAITAKAMGHTSMAAASIYQRLASIEPVREAVATVTDELFKGKK